MNKSDEDNLYVILSTLKPANETSLQPDTSNVYLKVLSILYIVGIVGSFLALLHLYRKRNFKNIKQAFMLK